MYQHTRVRAALCLPTKLPSLEKMAIMVLIVYTPANKVCAMYSTQFGCFGKLIRSDQFIYLVRRSNAYVHSSYLARPRYLVERNAYIYVSLSPYFKCASSEGSSETAHLRRSV